MLDHTNEAIALLRDKSRVDLDKDRTLNLALTRLLEIIGEAASQIPKEDQARYVEIPWPKIIGLRNRLIHGYDSIDLDIVWQIVTRDLPPLAVAVEKVISAQMKDSKSE
jgi:uncharacterized protein with HEPN domain